ncbi:MAG TPA: response regulator transcription factor [Ktedonobacteraceae bacterium]|nr:response regulator transcription factor [Ktedonobacteraceae bacterium]
MEERAFDHDIGPIRVLIIDDCAILRQGIRLMLNKVDDFKVVGEADNEQSALQLIKVLQPDIILLNNLFGKANGLDVARQLLRSFPNIRIVLISGSDDKSLLFSALRIGVYGYVQKTLSIDDVLKAVRAAKRGERFLGKGQAITQVVMEFCRLTQEYGRLRLGLTALEVELVRLVSNGCSNKKIGEQLFWSEAQVKRKMQDIYRKLQVTDRAQAVAEAVRQGLI